MEIEKHIIKPYTMNGGGFRYIGQGKVPTICAMYHNVFSTFPEKPYIMEIEKNIENNGYIKVDRKLNLKRDQDKASTLTIGGHGAGNHSDMDLFCVAMRGRTSDNPSDSTAGANFEQKLEANTEGKTNCLTTVGKDNLVMNGVSHAALNKCRIRRLTPTECARLQSIPDWYEWKGKFPDGKIKPTSDTQIYKMCGNGWNVEVIKHIFSFIKL